MLTRYANPAISSSRKFRLKRLQVEGEDWQRHRKISSPSFNERNSKLVWKEALQQAQPMLQSWMQEGRKGSIKTQQDVLTLALHVLTSAGFGLAYAFDSRDQRVQPGYSMTYGNALATVLKNLVFVFAVPHRLLLSPIAPARYRVIGEAIKDCKTYMKEFISMERRLIEKRDPGTGNLISSLVRNSDMMKFSATIADTKRRGLDEDEIYGNLFIFSLAGHETTANTLGYCIMLLAAFPQYQDWLREELTVVLGDSSPNEWDYEDTFPSLKRCLAVMVSHTRVFKSSNSIELLLTKLLPQYETLRLYGPVTAVPKTTKDTSQQLRLKDREILIPPGVRLELNAVGLHLNPQYWGIASAQWQPDRWIQGSNTGSESFMEPVKGSFIPWSEGPRVCPGRKFSQVEFVATIATLFQHHKVKAATLEEESSEAARSRIVRMINDSMVQGITLQMKDPQAVALVWTLFDPQ